MATSRAAIAHWVGVLIVVLLHLVVLKFLISYRLLPAPAGLASIFVDLIAPPPPVLPKVEPPKPQPRKTVEPKPHPRQLIAEAMVQTPTDYVVPEPPKRVESVSDPAPPPPTTKSAGPLRITTELAVACPNRRAPAYPMISKRLGETGQAVLRVELDEEGRVASVAVEKSSGHLRLDDAAVIAVKVWRCNPPMREGRPVRAIALQPFNFVLEGS